jgi:tetratricopeptide (TPR) repeat protein
MTARRPFAALRAAIDAGLVRKIVVVAIACPLLIYAVIAVGVSSSTALVAPRISLRWNPNNSDALSAESFATLESGASTEALNKAERLAQMSVQRSPLSPAAARTLGYVADARGHPDRALKLMKFSLRLSRRDLATHLWFINYYVGSDDLSSALNHYDMALRTSSLAHHVLMPILIQSTEDARLIRPLARILVRRPVWKDDFIRDVISKGPSAVHVAMLAQDLSASGNGFSEVRTSNLADRLVAEGHFFVAAKLTKRDYQRTTVTNGNFENDIGLSPFEWKLTQDFDFGAAIDTNAALQNPAANNGKGRARLQIDAAMGRGGEVASQLLLLPPGRYRLSANAGATAESMAGLAYWTVMCTPDPTTVILTVEVPMSSRTDRGSEAEFEVSTTGCTAQKLALSIRSSSDTRGYSGWVDNVTVTKVGPSNRL